MTQISNGIYEDASVVSGASSTAGERRNLRCIRALPTLTGTHASGHGSGLTHGARNRCGRAATTCMNGGCGNEDDCHSESKTMTDGLFGAEPDEPPRLKKGDRMRQMYGTMPGHVCRDCKHLRWYDVGLRRYSKCLLYGVSSCTATDWNSRGAACGRFEEALCME